ncbi:hypothetical protein Tco_0544941 [Tanacetum coccineum]
MEAGTTSTTLTARLPILNPGEYDLWLMRIEQYFLMTDYSLWEVILNGNKVLKRTIGETEQEYEPTTAEETSMKRNEIKLEELYSEVDSSSVPNHVNKRYATLKEQYDSFVLPDYKKSQFNLVSYKAGLESVEARLASRIKKKSCD